MSERLYKLFTDLGYTREQAYAIRSSYPISNYKDVTLFSNIKKYLIYY